MRKSVKRCWRSSASGGEVPAPVVLFGRAGLVLFAAGCLTSGTPLHAQPQPRPTKDTVTFAADVAPILFENCSSCHRPGGPAPFGLLSYEDAAPIADRIADVTGRRYMPPWLPTPGYARYVGERRLDSAQIATIRRWAEAGAPEGEPTDLPAAPSFGSGWHLGDPDLVLDVPSFEVPAGGRDLYRNLVLPVPGDRVRYVRAVDLRPGNAEVVHHARLMVDTTAVARELAAADPGPGFDGMELHGNARNPSGHFVGWTPGRVPHGGYEDLAWSLRPESDLVLQVHLRPTGRPETVSPRLGFYLEDEPPSRPAVTVTLGTEVIEIPPGAKRHAVTDSFTLPVPVQVRSVYPHAHYLGKTMEAKALLPDGRTEHLLHIRDWNFDWQDEYRFVDPIDLPAGTVLSMRYTYDNSAGNPRNPADPPVRVTYGPSSTDEMAELMLQVVPRTGADAAALHRSLARKYDRASLAHAAFRDYIRGVDARAEGDLSRALELFRSSLRQREDPKVLAAMGEVAEEMGDRDLAVLCLQRAVHLARRSGDAELVTELTEQLERVRESGSR